MNYLYLTQLKQVFRSWNKKIESKSNVSPHKINNWQSEMYGCIKILSIMFAQIQQNPYRDMIVFSMLRKKKKKKRVPHCPRKWRFSPFHKHVLWKYICQTSLLKNVSSSSKPAKSSKNYHSVFNITCNEPFIYTYIVTLPWISSRNRRKSCETTKFSFLFTKLWKLERKIRKSFLFLVKKHSDLSGIVMYDEYKRTGFTSHWFITFICGPLFFAFVFFLQQFQILASFISLLFFANNKNKRQISHNDTKGKNLRVPFQLCDLFSQ